MSNQLAFDVPREGRQESRIDANQAQANLSVGALDLLKEGRQMQSIAAPHQLADSSLYPDSQLTPGAVFPDVTASQVCTPGYTKTVRNVSSETKAEVFREYGITNPQPGQYEIDHFIPLELGGSNDISNLWPEPYSPGPGAHEKDHVENFLHKEVCNGTISLQEAQDEIRTDWYKVYLQMQNRQV
jgi:hypothetical protein